MKIGNIVYFIIILSGIYSIPVFSQYKSGPENKDFAGYLFAYFTGNSDDQEAVHYAVSPDGYNYSALNKGLPVLDSKQISSTGGVRDPHILRCENGSGFYMVLTDMTARKGWDSNRAMVLLKSDNLIDWSSSVVNIQNKYEGQEALKRVWAPQTIYDRSTAKYMVYWSMKHGNDGSDIIYYAYANDDFTDLEGEPKVLFMPQNKRSCIDGDIVEKNGLYYLFYKTEGDSNGIRLAITNSLTSGVWIEQPGYKQQTKDAVEGSCLFKRNNTDTYILMYDVYMKGRYQFCESNDLDVFKEVDKKITMDFKPRHGYVVPVTRRELKSLTDKWGLPDGFNILQEKNPVLEGYYADPEILYSENTQRYYIYPTSDGFEGWGGYYFKVFSSENMTDWTDEGLILDLREDVDWANNNAWAPAIIEKKIKGKYKYFYYFTAEKKIGVATSDHPTGRFKDSGKPLIDFKPEGIKGGQEIDPDVFTDPKTGKSYLYWGNGYLAVAELNKDMTSIKKNTIRVMTPDKTFREGINVFYRKGVYYFLWSENDTGSADYRVRYAMSNSPTGHLSIPDDNIILQKDNPKQIYGTGHHSVLQMPDTDEWNIVYHRISRPDGIKQPYPGIYREVCVDKMVFNEDGSIRKISPNL